ncbi:hypothetical protein RI367_003437 [Sorochytrium milnesiophthora]
MSTARNIYTPVPADAARLHADDEQVDASSSSVEMLGDLPAPLLPRNPHALYEDAEQEEEEDQVVPSTPVRHHAKQLTQNDGVFANMSAKPERPVSPAAGAVASSAASVMSSELPPDYSATMEDSLPPPHYAGGNSGNSNMYPGHAAALQQQQPRWMTWLRRRNPYESAPAEAERVLSQHQIDYEVDTAGMTHVLVDGLNVGSLFTFFITMFCSMSFQLVGFMLTYIMSMSHAGRKGSKAGFGVTLLQYGVFLRAKSLGIEDPDSPFADPADPFDRDMPPPAATPEQMAQLAQRTEWLAYFLMALGWLVIAHSTFQYLKMRRVAKAAMASATAYNAYPAMTVSPLDMASAVHVV